MLISYYNYVMFGMIPELLLQETRYYYIAFSYMLLLTYFVVPGHIICERLEIRYQLTKAIRLQVDIIEQNFATFSEKKKKN